MMKPIHVLSLIVALGLLETAGGCGRGPDYASGTVKGHITMDGKPVARGSITLLPAGDTPGPATGAPIEQGAFQCVNVPVGKQIATFTVETEMMTIVNKSTGAEYHTPKPCPPCCSVGQPLEVHTGENEHNFALASH